MKKLLIFPLVAAILFLSACMGGTNSESTTEAPSVTGPGESQSVTETATEATMEPIFKKEDMPRLDGSTANIPMAMLMLQRAAGMTQEEAELAVNFTTTPNAYYNLYNGATDLLLVYEADESMKAMIAESGVELEYHPIGRDALVFIANESNPVSNLTTKQLQDIYQGKITNWKDVGGKDAKIEAYQRPDTSGSQALMAKLVMKGLTFMDAPLEKKPAEMGGLVDALAEYNNNGNALGYSVYYYAENMYRQPGLKFISVDGVAPANETIASDEYPHTNEFYAVIRKNEPQGGSVRKMLQWILSDEGKQAVKDAGYVGV